MSSQTSQQSVKAVSRALAAEDISTGDFVVVIGQAIEYPSWMWCDDATSLPPDQPITVWWKSLAPMVPWKVVDVCLPLVLVRAADRTVSQLDVRHLTLARVDRTYARKVRKQIRKNQKRRLASCKSNGSKQIAFSC